MRIPHMLPGGHDLLNSLSGILSGAAHASGAEMLLPGGTLQDFGATLAQDPRQAGQQYADWRGPFIGEGDQMMIPIGPWGEPMGAALRTGPARSMQAKLRRQALLDMYRDVTKSIDQAPQSSFLENHIDQSIKEHQMRKLGMGRDQLQNNLLNRQAGARAFDDQDKAAWQGLNSLFPDPTLTEMMDPQLQGTLRHLLTNAKDQVNSRMAEQKRNTSKPFKGPAVPDVIQNHMQYVTNAMNLFAKKIQETPHTGPRQVVREAAARRIRDEARVMPQRIPGVQMNQRYLGIHKN